MKFQPFFKRITLIVTTFFTFKAEIRVFFTNNGNNNISNKIQQVKINKTTQKSGILQISLKAKPNFYEVFVKSELEPIEWDNLNKQFDKQIEFAKNISDTDLVNFDINNDIKKKLVSKIQ